MASLRAMTRPVRTRLLVSALIGLVRVAASVTFVWLSKVLVDIATGLDGRPLFTYAAYMVAVMVVQIICNVASSWWQNYLVVETQNKMRLDLFSGLLKGVWTGRESHHSGDLVNRLEEDVRVTVELICVKLPDIVVIVCQLLAASVYMFVLAPNLLWLLVGLMVVGVLGSRMFYKVLRRLTNAIREKESEAQQHIQENLQNRVLVLTLVGAERVLEKFGWILKDVRDNTVRRLNYNAISRSFMGVGFMFGYATAFLWGVFGIKNGVVTFGVMTAFLQLVGQIQRPIAELAYHVPGFINALSSIERLSELADIPVEEAGEPVFFDKAPEIRINDVRFAYEGQTAPVFDGFSCIFRAGKITEVTGPTGVGKSTLIRLVLALLKPSSGEVLIEGRPVSAATRCNCMYVPQGNSLMSGTIRDNLLMADADADEEAMRRALHLAAADFVLELPEGLDARCGETGSGLSEGQSQRIAVARALLCPGNVLILDEATSALDVETEKVLLKNLRDFCRGEKTVIFISHRESVASICDAAVRL